MRHSSSLRSCSASFQELLSSGVRLLQKVHRESIALQGNQAFRLDRVKPNATIQPMTQAVAHILEEVEQLSVVERADLADRLMASLVDDIPPDIEQKQIDEVRRRIAQVDSGEVTLIPAHVALEQVRQLVQSAQIAS